MLGEKVDEKVVIKEQIAYIKEKIAGKIDRVKSTNHLEFL
jgi:hypothetical protein